MQITRVGYDRNHGTTVVIPSDSMDPAGWEVCGDVLRCVTGRLPDPSNANSHHHYTISIPLNDIIHFMVRTALDAEPEAVSAQMNQIRTWEGPEFLQDDDAGTKTLFGYPPPPDLQRMLAWWLAIASGYRIG